MFKKPVIVAKMAEEKKLRDRLQKKIGIQDDHYRARRVKERRCASPASMILSKRGSFLKLPANLVHHGWRETFRTVCSSALTLLSSRSNTVTRCSNFIAVDGMLLPLVEKNISNAKVKKPESVAFADGIMPSGGL